MPNFRASPGYSRVLMGSAALPLEPTEAGRGILALLGLSASGSGRLPRKGTGSLGIGSLASSGTGELPRSGTGSLALSEFSIAGTAHVPVSQVDTVAFSPAPISGTYTLTINGTDTTASLNWNDSAATIKAAIAAAHGSDVADVVGSADAGSIELDYKGALAAIAVVQVTCDASSLVGQGTIGAVTETTAGETATAASVSWQFTGGSNPLSGGSYTVDGEFQAAIDQPANSGAWTWNGSPVTNGSVSGTSVATGSGQSIPTSDFTALTMDDPNNPGTSIPWDGTVTPSFTDGTDGTAEVQAIPAPVATGGEFSLYPYGGIPYNSTIAAMQAVIDGVGAGVITVGGTDGGPWSLTWDAPGPQTLLTTDVNSLTNTVTATPATPTPGG